MFTISAISIQEFIFTIRFSLSLPHRLDEIVMGGMVLETNINSILQAIQDQGKMHSDSLKKLGTGDSADAIRDRLGATNNW